MVKIAAHQPCFCPDSGFFDKMKAADIFILLNHVQFEKNNYQNRFFARGKWWTMAVKRGMEAIIHKEYVDPRRDWKKIQAAFPILKHVRPDFESHNLATINKDIIASAASLINGIMFLVEDWETVLTGTDRLVHICQNWKADTYLSGPSGRNYLELEKFERAGIKVEFFDPQNRRPLCEIL